MTKSSSRFVVHFPEYINFNRQTISCVDTKGAHYYSTWQEFWKVRAISNVCCDVKWRLYALIIILTCLTSSNKLTTKHKRFFYDKLKEQEAELQFRRLVGSNDQACSSGFYFRIAWKLTEQPSLFKIVPCHSCGSKKYKNKIGHNYFTF